MANIQLHRHAQDRTIWDHVAQAPERDEQQNQGAQLLPLFLPSDWERLKELVRALQRLPQLRTSTRLSDAHMYTAGDRCIALYAYEVNPHQYIATMQEPFEEGRSAQPRHHEKTKRASLLAIATRCVLATTLLVRWLRINVTVVERPLLVR